jgi:hypothetical protein
MREHLWRFTEAAATTIRHMPGYSQHVGNFLRHRAEFCIQSIFRKFYKNPKLNTLLH